jgi:GntR family transcriptional regulator/MocR family aminotransferase
MAQTLRAHRHYSGASSHTEGALEAKTTGPPVKARGLDPWFEIALDLPAAGSRESSRALHSQLKAAILDGRLKSGVKLPSTRHSQAVFSVSRNTVVAVYERLLNEGFVVSRQGSGTYVAKTLPSTLTTVPAMEPLAPDHRLNAYWLRPEVTAALGFWRDRPRRAPTLSAGTVQVDFRPALIDPRLFPLESFRRIIAKQLRGLEKRPPASRSPQGNQGNYSLRVAITNHIALTRAVACGPDDVVVTSGAQQAFDLLARILVSSSRNVVAMEDPGYPPMRIAFAAAGATLVPVPTDAEGLVVSKLPSNASVICVCPSHQFPLGVTMSKRRRRELIEFARLHGAVVIEDDYDGEFRYEGSPLEALRSAKHADVVFYVGTFSKCMLPSLRLGFVVAPKWAISTLTVAKNSLDWHSSTPTQLAVSRFISDGYLTRHVRKMRKVYGTRRQRLLKALRENFAKWLDPIPSFYGMHIAALARSSVNLEAVAEELQSKNVNVHTLSRYYLGPATETGLIFGYGSVDLPEMRHGLALLRQTLQKYD